MDGWEWSKIGTAVALACAATAAGAWIGGKLVPPVYPRQPGYVVEGVPPVDLAEAQRDWPTAAAASVRQPLLGYIRHIDQAVVPVASAAIAVPQEAPVDFATLLASAQPDRGRQTAQACLACHDVTAGGPNRIGPNLWGVVGRPVASHAGFAYSAAMQGHGGAWSREALDQFLARPGSAVPGTRMAFAGIRNPRDRANLIAYLSTLGRPE